MRNKSILIVEDSPTDAYALKQLIWEYGSYDIEVAEDGREAVRLAKELNPDLIIMDVVLPNMNGFQATRMLTSAKETSHIPVVILTTKGQETDRIWGLKQGALDYLTKPAVKSEVQETLKKFIELEDTA